MVTSLGTQSSALEAEVWADNWLSAVRAGRALLGEDGGIPQGASCAMSETGVVTILDAANRRRYVVQRAESAAPPSTAATAGPTLEVPPEPAAAVVDSDADGPPPALTTSLPEAETDVSVRAASAVLDAPDVRDEARSSELGTPNDRAGAPVDVAARKKQTTGHIAAMQPADVNPDTPRDAQESREAAGTSPLAGQTGQSSGEAAPPHAAGDGREAPGVRAPEVDGVVAPPADAKADTGASDATAPMSKPDASRRDDAKSAVTAEVAASEASPPATTAVEPPAEAERAESASPTAPSTALPADAAELNGAEVPSAATPHVGASAPGVRSAASPALGSLNPAPRSAASPALGSLSPAVRSSTAPAVGAVSPAARSSAAPARAGSSPATLPPVDSAAIRAAAERAAQSATSPLDDAQRSARAKQTRAYSAERADALRREFELSRSLSPFAPAGAPSGNSDLPRANLHAVPPVQRAEGSSSASGSARPKVITDAPQLDDDEHARTHPEGLVPMSARDVDPSEESPLTYRERAYWAASTADHARLEALLQAEYIKLRRTLIDSPRGQLIHLAAFDHVFEEQPERPPLATLEWKDWRGTAVFSVTQPGPVSSPRASSSRRRPVAPESTWPVPARSWPGGSQTTSSAPPSSSSWPVPGGSRPPDTGRPGARSSGAPSRPRPPSREPVPSPSSGTAGTSLDLGWPLAPVATPAAAAPDSAWPTPSPSRSSASSWPTTLGLPMADTSSWPSAPPSNAGSQPAKSDPQSSPIAPKAPLSASDEEDDDEWPVLVGGTLTAAEPASLTPAEPKPSTPAPSTPMPTATESALELAAPAALPVPPPPAATALPTRVSSIPASYAEAQREPTGEVDSRLASAFEAMPDLYFLPTPIAGLEFTIALIGKLVSCEATSACLYDINTDEFRFVALSGPGAQARRASAVKSQAGLFGCAKRDPDESLVVSNATRDSRFDAEVDGREGLEVRTLAYFPLRLGNQLLGMLQLINRSHERDFSSSDVAVLSYVSTQLAEFLFSRRTLRG